MRKTEIRFHGALREVIGLESARLAVASPAEAVSAILANWPAARHTLESHQWRVRVDGETIGSRDMGAHLPGRTLDFIPEAAGAADFKGPGKILGGILLIALSGGTALPGYLGTVGAVFALTGVASLLAPAPDSEYDEREEPLERPSFVFRGPINTQQPGASVPVVYGRFLVGSVVASALQTTVQEGSSDAP